MGKRKLIIILFSVISVTLISGIVLTTISLAGGKKTKDNSTSVIGSDTVNDSDTNSGDYTYIPPTIEDNDASEDTNDVEITPTEVPFVPATEMDLDITSVTVFVNKEYSLPKDYRPENMVIPNVKFDLEYYDERKLMRPEAAAALEDLFRDAQNNGIILYGISAYRSYNRQKQIFLNNIVKKGKTHTLKYSAVPGTSEHQTGLAIDLSTKGLNYKLIPNFDTTPEGIWLANNAYRFGFIIRYPRDKESITGYAYEPWHIRYVGKGLAKYLYDNDLTLDEYYKYTPSPGFDFETLYAEFINYKPPIVTVIPTGVPIEGEEGELVEDGLEGTDGDDSADADPVTPTEAPAEDTNEDGNEVPSEDDQTGELPDDIQNGSDSEDGIPVEDGNNSSDDGAPVEGDPALSPTPVITPIPTVVADQ